MRATLIAVLLFAGLTSALGSSSSLSGFLKRFLNVNKREDSSANCVGSFEFCDGGDTCVSEDEFCDGIVTNCKDGYDESLCGMCPPGETWCDEADTLRCFDPANQGCDGVADCKDGRDESDFYCYEPDNRKRSQDNSQETQNEVQTSEQGTPEDEAREAAESEARKAAMRKIILQYYAEEKAAEEEEARKAEEEARIAEEEARKAEEDAARKAKARENARKIFREYYQQQLELENAEKEGGEI